MKIKICILISLNIVIFGCDKNSCRYEKLTDLALENKIIYSENIALSFNLFNDAEIYEGCRNVQELETCTFKTSNYFYFSDGILFRYGFLDSYNRVFLEGFWGMSNNGIIYFKPIDHLDCPPYLILNTNKQNSEYSSKDVFLDQKCLIYDQHYMYSIKSVDNKDGFLITYHMLPLDGVDVSKSKHEKNAGYAIMHFSITEGIKSFKYDHNPEYVVLPWALDFKTNNKCQTDKKG